MSPSLSVIITSFNRRLFLESAINSVLSQSFINFELLILDNSSTDGSSEYLANLDDERIRVHVHDPMGISSQRNLGLELARAEFVAFLDDDDVWHPCKLENQFSKISVNPDVALVYTGYRFYSDDGKNWGEHSPVLSTEPFIQLLSTKDPFCGSASNPLMRKSCIQKVGGFDENVKTGEDWEMYLRLSKHYRFECVAEVLLDIRQHNGARLGDKVDAALETDLLVVNKHFSSMPKSLRALYFQKIAFKMIRLGKRVEALNYIKKAFGCKVFSISNCVLIFFLFLPRRSVLYLNNARRVLRQRKII